MQFSNTTSNNGIIQMIERTTGLGIGTITGNSDLFQYFTNLVNQSVQTVGSWLFLVAGEWDFDDHNYTNFPIATTALEANKYSYQLPSTLLRIKKVEIRDSSGDYYEIPLMRSDDPRLKNEMFQEDASAPTHYRLHGKDIIIYPKPSASDVTLSAGLRLTFDRESDAFTTADTTQEPGIALPFHPLFYYLPSLEYGLLKGLANVVNACTIAIFGDGRELKGMKKDLEVHYSNRDQNYKKVVRPSMAKYTFE